MKIILLISFLFLTSGFILCTRENSDNQSPATYIYASRDSIDLNLYVFMAQSGGKKPAAALAIFHGGGWVRGEASWGFALAKHFADSGITGISIQYRLSDEKSITPLDAIQDACDAIAWIRSNAGLLAIDPTKIAAYGWSAGGHLAVCTALFNTSSDSVDCSPNALILESPAVSLLGDRWPRRLLLDREDIRNISPDELVREGLPPTLIFQGDLDTVTPLAGAERFYRKMIEHSNRCELKVYKDYGHLFTPASIPDDGWPKPDPEIQADIRKTVANFLKTLDYMK